MTPSKGRLTTLLSFSAVAVGLILAAACSGQGEGDRCDTRAGTSDPDCASGLVCTVLGNNGQYGGVCCPPDRTNASGICALGGSNSFADSGPPADAANDVDSAPPDTGVPEAGEAGDAATDSSDDGSSDGSSDAGNDSPADAPADG